jgi:gas vesicle protein
MALKNGSMKFVEGLMIGGAVAATVALLYAPKSGKKLRKDIRRKSNELIDDAESRFDDIQEMAENVVDDAEKRIKKIRKNTESAIDDLVKRVKDVRGNVEDVVSHTFKN